MTSTAAASPHAAGTLPPKLVYLFGDGRAEGGADMRELLGGKGAGLSEMSRLGIPVPPGFTITTEVCGAYYAAGRVWPEGLEEQVRAGVAHLEAITGARFGDAANPLLVSVRSGARVSMPGMMDTVLNLGLNDATAEGLARAAGDERFAWDSYRRFVAMYGDVVLGLKRASDLDADPFEAMLERAKEAHGAAEDTDLPAAALRELVAGSKAEALARTGAAFPDDPWEQLRAAIGAVFESWESPRAVVYRDLHGYPGDWGTAVNVQAMVFGNLGEDCATGVAFTRNPKNGARGLFGEYLINAQGEDVVAGVRTPQPIRAAERAPDGPPSMEEAQPAACADLLAAAERLETHFRDMQDIEFTVQRGKLWVLQTRNGKRTGPAMVKVAADLVEQGLIDREEALRRQEPEQIAELLHPVFDERAPADVIARGLPASPGAAVGRAAFSAAEAAERAAAGEDVILVRVETSPEDIEGMLAARGILTARGGMTSHAAVVARGWGKCCVAGCGALDVDYAAGTVRVETEGRAVTVGRDDVISLNGTTGEVMLGAVPLADPELPRELERLMGWADAARRLGVRANADTPEDARRAREFGAEGIGLCRTEHMFFGEDRILAVRRMILAGDERGRRDALAQILPMQRRDFEGILRAMAGFPVTIRLLDPPLHEFLPRERAEIERVAAAMGVDADRVAQRVEALREFNPMLGHRGVRLAVTYPEIYEAQARAIAEADPRPARGGRGRAPGDHDPAGGDRRRAGAPARARRGRGGGRGRRARRGAVHRRRHHDRAAPRLRHGGGHRRTRRFLLLRHERPHADRLRPFARRRRALPAGIPAPEGASQGSLRGAGPRGRGRAHAHRHRARARGEPRPQARHLRRARWRPRLHRLRARGRAGLRLVLALPRAHRAAGGGARRAGRGRLRARVDPHRVRRRIEADEERLSPFAARSADAARARPEEPSPTRAAFQRDRDRIIHTRAFRRLKHKTQVFIEPRQDHFATRLAHTFEVAQVGRTAARALRLNEDLAEAIALGHDIGHGPFGHAGEEALAECLPEGFRHNHQSERVLDKLENDGRGLNLTLAVLDGVRKSSKARADVLAEGWGVPDTLEGQVVKLADAIAYLNHDIQDAIRADLIGEADLPDASRRVLGRSHGARIDRLVTDLVDASWAATGEGADPQGPPPAIALGAEVRAALNELREFMFRRIYLLDERLPETERAKAVVRFLFDHAIAHPDVISSGYALPDDPLPRRAADFVSGMTDRYAIRLAAELGCTHAAGWRL